MNWYKSIAQRIRQAIEDCETQYQEETINITVSIGISQVEKEDRDFEQTLKRADENLYHAKKSGRNRVSITSTNKGVQIEKHKTHFKW
ncbi:MAG: GGDEF domain-containing protein [Colwellia sp.]